MALHITITEREPGVYLVQPVGEIKTETHELLETRVTEILAKATALVIDMAGVSYISSMGLSAIFRIKLALENQKGTLALVGLQPKVALVFETMKILSPQVFASLEEADDFLDTFLDGVQKGTIKPVPPKE